MSKKRFFLICALVLSSFGASCTTSTSGDPESLAPATTQAQAPAPENAAPPQEEAKAQDAA